MFTKDYAKQVFRGEKRLLKIKEVKYVEVVKYDELSVKQLYGKLIVMPQMVNYFPAKYPKGRQCDRDYMFNVANTLHEEVITQLIQHALKQRHSVESMTLQNESVMINDHWAQELKSLPLVSRVSFRETVAIVESMFCLCI